MKIQVVFKSLFIALLAFFTAASSSAQSEKQPTAVKNAKVEKVGRHHKHDDNIAKELNLTPAQQAQFKRIDEEHAAKAKAARSAKKAETSKLRAESVSAHKALLTKEQAAKYDEILAKKKVKHEGKKMKKVGKKSAHKAEKAEKKAIKQELNKQ